MNVYFTFDYELFFGPKSGTVQNCIIKPTNELIKIAEKYGVKFVFFVDSGFLLKLQEYKEKYSILEKDYNDIVEQLEYLHKTGHDIQLHVHPHWEDSYFDGKKWVIDTSRYRLHQFAENEIDNIIYRYKKVLTEIVGNKVFAFRAGGWCIQPFAKIKNALKKHNVWLDSTVYRNGVNLSTTHYFDFRGAPKKDNWKFENDPLIEDANGFFTEIPISSQRLSPLFFWKFAITRKIPTKKHKMFGDGIPVGSPSSSILKMLTSYSYSVVSCDGYKSSTLKRAYKNAKKDKQNHFVVIGHPKALSYYAINKIDNFLSKYSEEIRVMS